MAFNPGGTDYGSFQRSRDRADEGLTRAQDSAGRAAKQARIKKSGERSGLQKLVSAGVRGAAAYYTGGMSEKMGAGGMIDEAMLGTDSEGRAVRNEYGDLVGAGSAIYEGSKAQKAGKLGEQDARFDKLLARRSKNVSDLYAAGAVAGGKEAQQKLESMEANYYTNRKDAEGKGWGGSGLGMSDEDYNLQPEAMTSGQRAAQVTRLNKTPQQLASEKAMLGNQGRRQQHQTSLIPPKADAPQGPTSFGVSDTSRGVQPYQRLKLLRLLVLSINYKVEKESGNRMIGWNEILVAQILMGMLCVKTVLICLMTYLLINKERKQERMGHLQD